MGTVDIVLSPSSTEPFILSIKYLAVFEAVRQLSSVQSFVQASLDSMLKTRSIVLSYDREDDRRTRVDAIPVSAKTNKLFLRLQKMDVIVSPAQHSLNVVASC
jgi:hypothetical protein